MSKPSLRSIRTALAAALAVTGAAASGLAGCEDPTNSVLVQLNLDRPVDVAFTCYGGLRLTNTPDAPLASDMLTVSAQPLASCDIRSEPRDPTTAPTQPLPKGQEDLTAVGGAAPDAAAYYGLILQSGPGTVAVARFPADRAASYGGNETVILDTDPLTPGKNSISVGTRPVAIVTDPTGCYAVTANAGSCDLSTLDVNSALQFDGQAKVTRLAVKNGAGVELRARPSAMVSAPGAAPIGQVCKANPTGLAYIAYPSCQLVAAVDLSTGVIQQALRFDATGAATVVSGATVTCRPDGVPLDECAGNAMGVAGPEPATLDLVRDDVRKPDPANPAMADLRPVTERLAIGGRKSNKLTVVNLDLATSLPQALMPISQVPLFERIAGQLGVLDVALSPQIAMGGANQKGVDNINGPQFQFVYAVATDGSVRVASVLSDNLRECDTQVDPRPIHGFTDVSQLSCIAVGSQPRRSGAAGPGIQVPTDGAPSAVNLFRVDPPPADTRIPPTPTRLNGYFGVITSTTGATYLVDIDDDDKPDTEVAAMPLAVDLSVSIPHQLRDQVSGRNLPAQTTTTDGVVQRVCNSSGPGIDETGALSGGPRLSGAFNRLTLAESMSATKAFMLPNLRHLRCGDTADTETTGPISIPELSFAAPAEEREERFPDTQALPFTEDWRFVWEGPLSGDTIVQDINGPVVRLGSLAVNGAGTMTMTDRSKPYCAAGVEPFDLLQLRGCDPTATTNTCPIGMRCFLHPEAALGVGTCIPEKATSSFIDLCRDFMVSVRRYTVDATPLAGALTLLPRYRELRSTPLTGCAVLDDGTNDNSECNRLARYEARQVTDKHPFEDVNTPAARRYQCRSDMNRKGGLNRCVMTCNSDIDCDSSSSCDEAAHVCMEGPIPPAECVAGVQRYDLRAGEAFTVLGGASGYVHPIIKESATSDKCVRSTAAADKLKLGRVPLTAPPCGAVVGAEPNPCVKDVTHSEKRATYAFDGAQCVESAAVETTRPAVPAIWFRNRGLSMNFVDLTYPGDFKCRGDRKGLNVNETPTPLVNVPTTFTGLAFTFRQVGGYSPQPLRTTAVVPVKVVRGPQQSIWLVDEGDYISESPSVASTRGKVFRIESSALGVVNVMQ